MSRAWVRCAVETSCGRCTRRIFVGDAMFVIAAGTWRKRRCEFCAGEPTPSDLPALTVHPEVTDLAPNLPARFLASSLPFDFKRGQGGDRD